MFIFSYKKCIQYISYQFNWNEKLKYNYLIIHESLQNCDVCINVKKKYIINANGNTLGSWPNLSCLIFLVKDYRGTLTFYTIPASMRREFSFNRCLIITWFQKEELASKCWKVFSNQVISAGSHSRKSRKFRTWLTFNYRGDGRKLKESMGYFLEELGKMSAAIKWSLLCGGSQSSKVPAVPDWAGNTVSWRKLIESIAGWLDDSQRAGTSDDSLT